MDVTCQASDAPLSRKSGGAAASKDGCSTLFLTRQSGSANSCHSTHPSLSRSSHPSSQSIHGRPTVILFVQINNEIAAASHGGTQRVVIAAFQAGSDGLCGRLARLHCDLVCVFVIFHKLRGYEASGGPQQVHGNPSTWGVSQGQSSEWSLSHDRETKKKTTDSEEGKMT